MLIYFLNDELQALSKGVTATGQNINLSASEYDRYKEIIAEIIFLSMPDNLYSSELVLMLPCSSAFATASFGALYMSSSPLTSLELS